MTDLQQVGEFRLSVLDKGNLGRSSTDVQRHQIGAFQRMARQMRGKHGARGRTGLDHPDGMTGRDFHG